MSGQPAGGFDLPGKRRRAVLSLAPLIDVTFILLIFFMLVTQFQRFSPVNVELESGRAPVVEESGDGVGASARITLAISADGTIRVADEVDLTVETLQQPLADLVSRLLAEGRDNPVIAVEPAADVPLQVLLNVVGAMQTLPSVKMQIVVPEGGEALQASPAAGETAPEASGLPAAQPALEGSQP